MRVVEMMAAMQEEIGLDPSDEQLRDILMRLLNRDFYDHAGLIYGIGHAIYTLSDPRAEIIRSYCERLAKEKGREQEFTFYRRFEQMAITIMKEVKGIDVCANVDLYSGFAYTMLNIPRELYTPLFVCSRISGWLLITSKTNYTTEGSCVRLPVMSVNCMNMSRWRNAMMKTVTVFKGDGIGPEITDAVLKILKAAKAPLAYEIFQVGLPLYEQSGELVSEEAFASLKRPRCS